MNQHTCLSCLILRLKLHRWCYLPAGTLQGSRHSLVVVAELRTSCQPLPQPHASPCPHACRGSAEWAAVTSSVSARTSFINNLVNLMKSAGAVGLDIDWEVRAGQDHRCRLPEYKISYRMPSQLHKVLCTYS
jgi:hypothetical protein